MGLTSYLTIVALEVGIILSQILNFLDEVVLVCFGMRLVYASKFACSTSATNIWSGPITLEKKRQARKLAFAGTKRYAWSVCPCAKGIVR